MKSILLFLACSCAIMAVSCQKNEQNPPAEPPVTNSGTVRVQLKLTGDILTSEGPLGRRANEDVLSGARAYENTLYAIRIAWQGGLEPIYQGLFSHPDSLYVDVPTTGAYNISIHIFKKGTGGGINYSILDGYKYFTFPLGCELKNRMDTVTRFPNMIDSVGFMSMAHPTDSNQSATNVRYPELEYYQGDLNFLGSANPAPISINVKRRSFGVRFSADNFTGGELMFEFSHTSHIGGPVIDEITVTPANINSDYHILAADDFRWSDSTYLINVKAIWKKPDGNWVTVGTKDLHFKRNVMTKMHLTISMDGRAGVRPQITETDWAGNELINF